MQGLQLQVGSSVSENAIDAWEVPVCPIQNCETQEAAFPLSNNPGSDGGNTLRQGLM